MPESQRHLEKNLHPVVSIDGRIVHGRQASISIDDWSFRFGWGAFETIRVTRSCPLFLMQHLARLKQCARALMLTSTDEDQWWPQQVRRVLRRCGYAEAVLNLFWTRGGPPDFAGRRILTVRPMAETNHRSVRIWIPPWRVDPTTPGVGMKTLSYFPNMFAHIAAQATGFDDAVLVTPRGDVLDGARASVFAFSHGRLLTPRASRGALPGIVRAEVLAATRAMRIPVTEGRLPLKTLLSSNGVFLTSSLRGLVPVGRIGEQQMRPGTDFRRLAARLRAAYRKSVAKQIADFKQ